jgi:hypothetical protein
LGVGQVGDDLIGDDLTWGRFDLLPNTSVSHKQLSVN